MHDEPGAGPAAPRPRRPIPLHLKILCGLVFGGAFGIGANWLAARPAPPEGVVDTLDRDGNGVHDRLDFWAGDVVEPLGKVFLRLICMVVIPLIFSALALGAAGIGSARRLGRLGLKTLGLTVVLSSIAVLLGIGLVNWFSPGSALTPEIRAELRTHYGGAADAAIAGARAAKPLKDTLLDVIPENPFQEIVGAMDASSKGNGILAVMFFALAVGIAVNAARERCAALIAFLEGVNAACMAIIGFAMHLAPYGVACLVFGITARLGLALVPPLAGFMGVVLLGLLIQFAVVYPLAIRFLARLSPLVFFRKISEAMWTAFGTSSSNATLPTSLRVAHEELRLPRDVSSFVLTMGATGNQNGTALYEGVVVLFLAQVFAVDLTFGQQLTVVLMAILAGVGTAGVPGGSLPMIVVVLQSVGIPAEGIGMILGIDRVLDMSRTLLNVTGDLAIAACVAGDAPDAAPLARTG